MDEAIRIYSPSRALAVRTNTVTPVRKVKTMSKWQENWEILKEITARQEAHTRELQAKYPWVNLMFNWIIALLLVMLAFSLVWWGMDIRANEKAAADYDAAVQEFYTQQEAKAQEERAALLAAQNSEQARREADYKLMAQFLDGISGFVKNRGYTTIDLITYAQCPLNRILNPGFWCQTLEEALRQEGQWVGFSTNNQVTAENYEIAKRVIDEFYDNAVRPCGNEYCWTEFTDRGLYLKSDFGPATFDNTWRYNGQ